MIQTPSDERKAMLQKYSRMVIDSYPNVAEAFIFGLLDKVTSEAQQTITAEDEAKYPPEYGRRQFLRIIAEKQQTITDLTVKLEEAKKLFTLTNDEKRRMKARWVNLARNYWRVHHELESEKAKRVKVEEEKRTKPWCSTCGETIESIQCPKCMTWWAENSPPTSTEEKI